MKTFLSNLVKNFSLPLIMMLAFFTTHVQAEKFQRPLNIIILESMTLPPVQERAELLMKHIADEYHLKPGVHVQYTRLNAKGEVDTGVLRLHETMDIVQPDLVISIATVASQAAKKVLDHTNVPQIFFFVTDPVKAGLVESFDGGHENIAGISHMVDPDTKLSLITNLLSTIDQEKSFNIGYLNTTYPSEQAEKQKLMEVLANYPQINLIDVKTAYTADASNKMALDFTQQINALNRNTPLDFIWIAEGPNAINTDFLTRIKNKTHKDLICVGHSDLVKQGGVMSITSTIDKDVSAIADYVYRALQGDPVSQMDVKYTDGYEISLNLTTAKNNNIVVPASLLTLADDRVYH